MKIKKTKIIASVQAAKIPEPFNQFYRIQSEKEFEDTTGLPAKPYEIEEIPGYGIKHIAYLIAKDDYYDELANNGISDIDLVSEDGDIYPAYYDMDRVYRVYPEDMPGNEEVDAATDVCANTKWAYRWGVDDGDAESGPLVNNYWEIIEAPTEEEAKAIGDSMYADNDGFCGSYVDLPTEEELEMDAQFSQDMFDDEEIMSSVKTELNYWYKLRHGLGPGTLPKDVNVLKVVEDGYKDYVLLDKMLTTDELNEFDIKEEEPSEDLLQDIHSSTAVKVKEGKDTIDYKIVDGATEETSDNSIKEFKNMEQALVALDDVLDNGTHDLEVVSIEESAEDPELYILKVVDHTDGIQYETEPLPSYAAPSVLYSSLVAHSYPLIDKEDEVWGATEPSYSIDELKKELDDKLLEIMLSPRFGFSEEGDKWVPAAKDCYILEVKEPNEDYYSVEVRFEGDYDTMDYIAEQLNPIVEKADPDAYFDMVDPGIIEAYLRKPGQAVDGSTEVTASGWTNKRDKEYQYFNYEDYKPVDPFTEEVSLKVDAVIEVDENGSFEVISEADDMYYNDDTKSNEWIVKFESPQPEDYVVEKEKDITDYIADDLYAIMEPQIPSKPGKYKVTGFATLDYVIEDNGPDERDVKFNIDSSECKLDVTFTPIED